MGPRGHGYRALWVPPPPGTGAGPNRRQGGTTSLGWRQEIQGSSPLRTLPPAPGVFLYGGDDERVNATIDPVREELEQLGRRFEVEIYEGAGHGFLRQQEARDGANRTASQSAWPRAPDFLRHAVAHR